MSGDKPYNHKVFEKDTDDMNLIEMIIRRELEPPVDTFRPPTSTLATDRRTPGFPGSLVVGRTIAPHRETILLPELPMKVPVRVADMPVVEIPEKEMLEEVEKPVRL